MASDPADSSPPSVFGGENERRMALIRIENERRTNQDKWMVESTGIAVDPSLLLELELQNPESLIHPFLELMNDNGSSPEVKLSLEKCLSFLKDEECDEKDRARLLQLGAIFSDRTDTPYCILRDIYSRVYETVVRIRRHKDFPTELFMVDLSFLPESFFFDSAATDDNKNSVLHRYYNACLSGDSTIAPKMKTTHIRHCTASGKTPERQFHQDFCFNNSLQQTKKLQLIFAQLLQKYASMQESFSFEWSVSFLFTETESQQDPHVDYRHKTMNTYRDRQKAGIPWTSKRKRELDTVPPIHDDNGTNVDLPWSLDMPLMKGGMRLAFYGTERRELLETPQVIQVPFRNALFWRGDCVHAGCLADLFGGPGFRMHGYLPLKPQHRHMTYMMMPEIEWNDITGKCRYSHRLRRHDGTEFPRGNEWV